jgi:hypothetical protein
VNSNNRPPTNAELAQIKAETEAREAAKAAELQQQKQARNRLDRLRKLQRNLPSQTSLIGTMRAPSPNTGKKYINGRSGVTGGKRKTLRNHNGKKAKKTNKRRH